MKAAGLLTLYSGSSFTSNTKERAHRPSPLLCFSAVLDERRVGWLDYLKCSVFSLCLLWYTELVAPVLPPPHTHTIRHVSLGSCSLEPDCTFSDFGLGHLACFGQQKMSKRNAGRGLGYTERLGASLHLCLHQEGTSQ